MKVLFLPIKLWCMPYDVMHVDMPPVQCILGLNGDRISSCTLNSIHPCVNKVVVANKSNCLSVTAICDAAYLYSRLVHLINIYLYLRACEARTHRPSTINHAINLMMLCLFW